MSRRPLVSVIIINWNGESYLRSCLESLMLQDYRPIQCIVADNGSTDGSAAVATEFGAIFVPNGSNLGVAAGNNAAVSASGGELLLFVNNDMRFDPRFVSELACVHSGSNVFASDGQQLDWESGAIVHAATRLAARWRPHGGSLSQRVGFGRLAIVQDVSTSARPVLQASGANIMVDRARFEALGGFDGRMPAGWEDTDICVRAWARGWASIYQPAAVCWHRVGGSSASAAGRAVRLRGSVVGRGRFAVRVLPFTEVVLVLCDLFGGVIASIARRRGPDARMKWRSILEVLRDVPDLLRVRRGVVADAGNLRSLLLQLQSPNASRLEGEC